MNTRHQGQPEHDTADFNDRTSGNLRIDYVLPSRPVKLQRAGVFWPRAGELGADWIAASDHRLVWD